jgi:hypothetical protein
MSRKRHLGAARQQSLKADTYKKSLPPVKLDNVQTNIEGETSSCKLLFPIFEPTFLSHECLGLLHRRHECASTVQEILHGY